MTPDPLIIPDLTENTQLTTPDTTPDTATCTCYEDEAHRLIFENCPVHRLERTDEEHARRLFELGICPRHRISVEDDSDDCAWHRLYRHRRRIAEFEWLLGESEAWVMRGDQ